MGDNWKYIYWLIPLIVLVFVVARVYLPEGMWSKLTKSGNFIDNAKAALSSLVGTKEVAAQPTQVNAEHKEALTKLVGVIEKAIKSPREDCFVSYGGFPGDLEKRGTQIDLVKEKILVKTREGKIIDAPLSRELSEKLTGVKFKPCVIATDKVAKNFYDNFLLGTSSCPGCVGNEECSKKCKQPYWHTVDQITIKTPDEISYDEVEDQNLQDGGLLFKAEEGNICFFPTKGLLGSNEQGLNPKFLAEKNSFSLPRLVSSGVLPSCELPQEFVKYRSVELQAEPSGMKNVHLCKDIVGEGDCVSLCQDKLGFILLPEKGCWVAISAIGGEVTSRHCAWGVAEPFVISEENIYEVSGEFYPKQQYLNYALTESNIKIIPETFSGDEVAKRLNEVYSWPTDKALICLDSYWYACEEDLVDKQLEFTGISSKRLPLTFKCSKEGKDFFWKIVEKESSGGITIQN